jgi:hypothetical protein
MAYDYSSIGQPVFLPPGLVPSSSQHVLADVFQTTIPQYFGMVDVSKLIDYNSTIPESASHSLVPVQSAEKKDAGPDIHISNIANVTSSIVKVTYAVHADHSTERGTYLLNLKICPGELVTVGDKPHQGSLPWDARRGGVIP